jgi:hypothetical protein
VRGGALPPALLCAALGFALAFAETKLWRVGIISVVVAAVAAAWVRLPAGWTDAVFLGCWSSTALNSARVNLVGCSGRKATVLLCVNTGIWAGAVISVAGRKADLLVALPCMVTLLPASWAVRRGGAIAVRVVCSWLLAVAILAATLQFLPVTPGYLPDHMD